ncbi:hypothetical protein EIO_0220 [Ketogulonicigenium vulgare Y25]|nr:hypothetical protein EIO_0220 [Ketogulonicigenium vulgare Y25]
MVIFYSQTAPFRRKALRQRKVDSRDAQAALDDSPRQLRRD